MNNLINGKEVLIALANGEEVEFKCCGMSWTNLDAKQQPLEILIDKNVSFRLKSKTIMLNGIEVPKPFVPKVGETYWFIADYTSCGYSNTQEGTGINSGIGKWKSEEEVKQVVAALRSVFKTD